MHAFYKSWLDSSGVDPMRYLQQGNGLAEGPSAQQQDTLVDSQPYFGFAPAEDPQALLIATSLYFRIQVRASPCMPAECTQICAPAMGGQRQRTSPSCSADAWC